MKGKFKYIKINKNFEIHGNKVKIGIIKNNNKRKS